MSDGRGTGTDGGDDWADDWSAPNGPEDWSPPPGPTTPTTLPRPVEPALTLDSEGTVQRSGSGFGGRAVAAVLGVVLVVGGTVFAVSQLGSAGPESPEAAVDNLLDAASDEDVLGLLAALEPGERDSLRKPVEALFAELERLEVVDSSFQLTGIDGIDLSFEDVTYRSEAVRDDLVRVYFTGGTVTSSIDGGALPVGDFVSDTLDRFGVDITELDESATEDIAGDDTFLVARNGTDGWRVSIAYTAAEAARLDAGLPLPASGVTPLGADSPEQAVDALLRAGADFDLREVIARLAPGEMGALQDYAGLFLDDAERALADARNDLSVTVDQLALRSESSGDRASVFVDSFALTVSSEGETVQVSTDGECLSIGGDLGATIFEDTPFADGPVCAGDLDELSMPFTGFGFGTGDIDAPEFPSLTTPMIGITTIRSDGQWYVAPVATSLDAMVAGLGVLERSHLDAIVDYVEQFMEAVSEPFSASTDFGAVGEPLDEDFYDPSSPGQDTDEFGTGRTEFNTIDPLLEDVVRALATDDVMAACLLDQLADADPVVVNELIDAHLYDIEPGPVTQQVFGDTFLACSGR